MYDLSQIESVGDCSQQHMGRKLFRSRELPPDRPEHITGRHGSQPLLRRFWSAAWNRRQAGFDISRDVKQTNKHPKAPREVCLQKRDPLLCLSREHTLYIKAETHANQQKCFQTPPTTRLQPHHFKATKLNTRGLEQTKLNTHDIASL